MALQNVQVCPAYGGMKDPDNGVGGMQNHWLWAIVDGDSAITGVDNGFHIREYFEIGGLSTRQCWMTGRDLRCQKKKKIKSGSGFIPRIWADTFAPTKIREEEHVAP